MSNETSPRRLEVVGTVPASVAPHEVTPPTLGVGQICTARPDEGPDVLVLITEVSDDHVQVLLCTDDDGIATETDAVLEPRITGRPHRLLIHGDVAGSILRARLTRLLGADRSGDRATHRPARLWDGLQLARPGTRRADPRRVRPALGRQDEAGERAQNGESACQRAWLEDRRAQTLTARRPV